VQGGVRCGDQSLPGVFINLEHPLVKQFVHNKMRGNKKALICFWNHLSKRVLFGKVEFIQEDSFVLNRCIQESKSFY